MERWGAKGEPAKRLYADQPSFSSTLLDAIYKSMDEPGEQPSFSSTTATKTNKKREDYYYRASLAGSYRGGSRVTSSSSDCSSYGGFSSSEAESSQHRHRLRPIRTTVSAASCPGAGGGSAPAALALTEKKGKKPGAAIRAKLRDLRAKPASPGARLAGFLNSIFAGGGGNKHHHHHHRGAGGGAAATESACSTASSSYSRSCLSKTPSTRGGQPNNRRTVRFLDADLAEAAPASDRRRAVQVGVVHLEQMLLSRMEMESDDDYEDSSDASSDLFELESLGAAAVAPASAEAAYRDELPVYETTRLSRGIVGHGHGYATAAHGRSTRVV